MTRPANKYWRWIPFTKHPYSWSIVLYQAENKFDSIISQAAALQGIPAALLKSVLAIESAFNPSAVSSANALGIGQMLLSTARSIGYTGPQGDASQGTGLFDPRIEIPLTAKYLRMQLDRYGGDIQKALSAYNAGHSMIPAAGPAAISNNENREYVRKGVIHYNYYTGALTAADALAALRSGLWMKIAVISAGAIGLLMIAALGLLLFAVVRR